MKTAAAIILLVALLGMYPKHKKKRQPGPATPTPIVYQCNQTFDQQATVQRIVRHARSIRPNSGQSNEELTAIAGYIVRASSQYCVEPELAAAVIARESAYNPRATSPAGACGLGQLMPGTARRLGISDCYNAEQNANGSILYIKNMLDKWSGYDDQVDRALVSYLVGPGNVERNGVNWGNSSTRRYLEDVYAYRNKIKGY